MINGMGIGIAIGLFGLFWLFGLLFDRLWLRVLFVVLAIITMITPPIIGAKIGIYEDNNKYLQFIAEYKATKEIYLKSINNKKLSDLEKINMVSKISYLNSELESKKIEYTKWYYKVDYSLIAELEPINSYILVGE